MNSKSKSIERIFGSLLSSAYGDSAGARLEFQKNISIGDVDDAINLNGGGIFNVAPGQVTDDSELSIQLFKALIDYTKNNNKKLNVDDFISKRYIDWFKSSPFDIGSTTRNAFQSATNKSEMIRNAYIYNQSSLSNGALMRCIPIAAYAFKNELTEDEIFDLVCKDVKLTHSQQTVANLVFLYIMILIYLYNELDWDNIKVKLNELCKILGDERINDIFENYHKYEQVNVYRQMGWDQHAFSLVLYTLENNFEFIDAIKFVLGKGGDTDTNAAIVGGVMGAKFGYKAIPLDYLVKLLKCVPNHNRGAFHPKIYFDYYKDLLSKDDLLQIYVKIISEDELSITDVINLNNLKF